MNIHVDFGAQDWEIQHRAANVASCDRLLTMLIWKHPEQMRYNPRLLPAPRFNISPIVKGYFDAMHRDQKQKKREAELKEAVSAKPPTIARIRREVAKYYGIRHIDIISARRTADITWPRQIAMYLCRNLTPFSYPQIGRQFGNRDHTTCLHAVRKVDARVLIDAKTAKDVAILTKILGPAMEPAE